MRQYTFSDRGLGESTEYCGTLDTRIAGQFDHRCSAAFHAAPCDSIPFAALQATYRGQEHCVVNPKHLLIRALGRGDDDVMAPREFPKTQEQWNVYIARLRHANLTPIKYK
jgi:hypothetical protein